MSLDDILVKFGLPGIFILVLILGIKWGALFLKDLMKQHREEREQWSKTQEKQNDDHNKSLNKNTEVLSELTTLIKSIKK